LFCIVPPSHTPGLHSADPAKTAAGAPKPGVRQRDCEKPAYKVYTNIIVKPSKIFINHKMDFVTNFCSFDFRFFPVLIFGKSTRKQESFRIFSG
jgi:hypothetical protein